MPHNHTLSTPIGIEDTLAYGYMHGEAAHREQCMLLAAQMHTMPYSPNSLRTLIGIADTLGLPLWARCAGVASCTPEARQEFPKARHSHGLHSWYQ
jgi:hypothetical protein